LDTLTPKHAHAYHQMSFSSFAWNTGGVWMCKLGVISQEQLMLEIKLLLNANRKSYMPRRLAWPWVTLNGRFHASGTISAVAELFVHITLRKIYSGHVVGPTYQILSESAEFRRRYDQNILVCFYWFTL